TYDPGTGYPYTFMSLDMPAKLAMWETGPDALLAQSRYAALLVSMHGSRLYKDLDRSAFEREIRATLDASDAEIERNHRLVWMWDSMSLALLLGCRQTLTPIRFGRSFARWAKIPTRGQRSLPRGCRAPVSTSAGSTRSNT